MSYGYAYRATSAHRGLSDIIVNCDADKLVITSTGNPYVTLPGDSALPQCSIYWSNVSKFSVDHLIRGAHYSAGAPTTRMYHFEFVNFVALPVPFQMLLGPSRKLSFSITDQQSGTSLLFDAIELGCLDRMNKNGDCLWEILDDLAQSQSQQHSPSSLMKQLDDLGSLIESELNSDKFLTRDVLAPLVTKFGKLIDSCPEIDTSYLTRLETLSKKMTQRESLAKMAILVDSNENNKNQSSNNEFQLTLNINLQVIKSPSLPVASFTPAPKVSSTTKRPLLATEAKQPSSPLTSKPRPRWNVSTKVSK